MSATAAIATTTSDPETKQALKWFEFTVDLYQEEANHLQVAGPGQLARAVRLALTRVLCRAPSLVSTSLSPLL